MMKKKPKRKRNDKVGYAAMVLGYNNDHTGNGERPQSFSARPLTDESQYTVVQTKKKPRKP